MDAITGRLSQLGDEQLDSIEQKTQWLLWMRGEISWLLLPYQKRIYDLWYQHDSGIVVSNVSRQAGKSFTWLLICIEKCLRADLNGDPISVVFAAPGKTQALDIFDNSVEKILGSCPPWLRPKIDRNRKIIKFNQGSIIRIIGTDDPQLKKRVRGTSAHFVVLDECAFMKELEDFIKSIIIPMFNKTNNGIPRIAASSTPPEEQDHYFLTLKREAERNGRYFVLRADEIFSKEDFERIKDNYHVKDPNGNIIKNAMDDPKFRREYLCEFSALNDRLVVPTWQEVKRHCIITPVEYGEYETIRAMKKFGFIPEMYKPPAEFEPYVLADYGWVDNSGVVFGFVDYEMERLIIQDELFIKEKTPSELAELIIDKVRKLWPKHDVLNDVKYFMETGVQGRDKIAQIRKDTGLRFIKAKTSGKNVVRAKDLSQVSKFINTINSTKIYIYDNCQYLLATLDKAQWVFDRKGNRKNDFIRTEDLGHCDLLDALILLNNTVKWKLPHQEAVQVNKTPKMLSDQLGGSNEWLKLKRK